MRYLLPLLLIASIANAGQEPQDEPEARQVYLFILMNGRGSDIKRFKSPFSSLEACHAAIDNSKHKGHTKAFVWCGTSLINTGVVSKPDNETS